MIKILVPSIYENIKGRSEKLVYICLWAWLNIEWRKMFYAVAKEHNFEYKGEMPIEAPDGSIIKVPAWWDTEALETNYLLVLNPAYYPNIYHELEIKPEIIKIMPKGAEHVQPRRWLSEKEFLEKFAHKRTTFIKALYKLKESEYIDFETALNEKKVKTRFLEFKDPLVKFEKMRISNETLMKEQQIIKEKGYSWLLDRASYTYKGKKIRLPFRATKIINTPAGKEIQFPLIRIVQLPLNILTRKDLTIAERLIGIELCRMKKEEGLNIRNKGNKSLFYIKNKRIKLEDLAEKIGFSKPIICGALRKL